MNTQPVPTMPNFNGRVEEFRIWQPETYERNLRGATMGSVDEGYLFLVCAYDYVFNPGDLKLVGIQELFMTPDNRRSFPTDTYWTINIPGEEMQRATTLLGNAPVPGAPNPARRGGLKTQGPANYNLFTKAIEICCAGFVQQSLRESMAAAIQYSRDKPITAEARAILVRRYNTLRAYYVDQTLTKFGLVYR